MARDVYGLQYSTFILHTELIFSTEGARLALAKPCGYILVTEGLFLSFLDVFLHLIHALLYLIHALLPFFQSSLPVFQVQALSGQLQIYFVLPYVDLSDHRVVVVLFEVTLDTIYLGFWNRVLFIPGLDAACVVRIRAVGRVRMLVPFGPFLGE